MMGKTKIVHVVEALGGGIYSYFIDLTHFFGENKNIETYVIYSDKRKEINPNKIKDDFHKATSLIKVEMKKEISPFHDLFSILKISKIFNNLKPDIIHLHSSKAGVLGRISNLISKNSGLLYYTPHGYSFLKRDISKKKQDVYRLIEKKMANLFGGKTIACGDTEFNYAIKFGNANLIRNGVNINEVRTFKARFSNKILTVGILGRITFARNPLLFNKIALQFPDILFIWIGDGELRNQLTAPNIKITGWFINRFEGLSILNTLDVYIQTSLWEGLPISVIEAMVLEKPVIATNIIGNKDIVKHEQTGFLINNLEEFVFYLKKLKEPYLRKEMGQKSFERAKELFDSKKNFQALQNLYLSDYSQKHLSKEH